MNAVTKIKPDMEADEATAMSLVFERAVLNPEIDADKMERLYALQERMMDRSARVAFTEALADLQPRLPVIDENGAIKNSAGTVQSTYAKWEDINDVIKPLLSASGFTLSFRPGTAPDGKITVTTVLSHRAGHHDEATVTLPYDSSGSKNGVQAVGSSFSYGKRYGAIALLNITSRAAGDRDDNGQAGGMGAAAQHATSEINLCETAEELRAWKSKNFDGVSKIVSALELREIIALYNRRIKAAKAGVPANG